LPRGRPAERREPKPDFLWNSRIVGKLVTTVMRCGKRSVAEQIVYGALQRASDKTQRNPLEVLEAALRNLMPTLEVRPRRVGGQTYQVPVEVRADRKLSLSLRWLIQAARERGGRSMEEKLAGEILDAAENTGGAIKKKEDTHRMAESNKAFAHYRW